ncbi:PREDICTED: transmembrane protein 74B-like [Branchiostoma belcheri]|uniref:Transmembrane protein 74B-like n=1 Tax=Branchiostoma belcheri TaxID=7741 RepID=A0A6P5AFI2_BRABE|nr:PREDICTED: transmembrane protein 74B-like [Branchiostoma belcheri]XP_019645100.1 PREDICTED: transmembrane protein 74B-like [Branchiostoma belcheri]
MAPVDGTVNNDGGESPRTDSCGAPSDGDDALVQRQMLGERTCLGRTGAKRDPVDSGFILSLCFLVLGIVLVAVAWTIPREPTVDPDTQPAREIERIETKYVILRQHLDNCVMAGIIFLTLGGISLSLVLLYAICMGELNQLYHMTTEATSARDYGSVQRFEMSRTNRETTQSLVDNEMLVVNEEAGVQLGMPSPIYMTTETQVQYQERTE